MKTKLVKAKELVPMLNVSLATIYMWAREGKIPSVKLPNTRTVRFDPAQVEAKLKEASAPAQS